MSLLNLYSKTFLVKDFGLVIGGTAIPANYYGRLLRVNAKFVTMEFTNGEGIIHVAVSVNELYSLLRTERIVDAKDFSLPVSEARFKIGDFVLFNNEKQCVVDYVNYDYNKENWKYSLFTLGDDFMFSDLDGYYFEDELILIDEINIDIFFKGKGSLINIRRK